MQLVKTLGRIRIVLSFGKLKCRDSPCHSAVDVNAAGALEPAYKALILNGHGQTHGTGKLTCRVNFEYYAADIGETIGCFYFFYGSADALESQNIINPAFMNHDAHGMPQILSPAPTPSRYPVRTLSNGCLGIDLTCDDD
ncbi:hypothetical protein F53441_13497 [Fusarium austroafricanum]|uniref:Uncharacterized protein n=1 Tax=Fusarium austroafricanum TaxID=2364996 RepID=A0A8H4JQ71_9HYPO|nr:hypothetical protein F53441_13497 [Fusarium austroafricanum]